MIARKAILALLALVFVLPVGSAAAADSFDKRFKVIEVFLKGKFTSRYDDGAGHQMTATETIRAHGLWKGTRRKDVEECERRKTCELFRKGSFRLRKPVRNGAPNGLLTTSPFQRYYVIEGSETRPNKPPVSCGRKVTDKAGFGAPMWATGGGNLTAFWSLPAVAIRCDLNGGEVSADPIDRTSSNAEKQFTDVYDLGPVLKRSAFTFPVRIKHEWTPDPDTFNTISWTGNVVVRRVR